MASALGFAGVLAGHISFANITTGFITKYHEQPLGCVPNPCLKQDLSGVATDGNVIIFADDGGDPALADFGFNFIRVTTVLPDVGAVNLPLTLLHKDLEGATFWPPYFVVTTSLEAGTGGAAPPVEFRRLTRFKVNETKTALIEQLSVDLRGDKEGTLPNTLTKAIREEFGVAWFDRIKVKAGKEGGLNIEGLSNAGRGSTANRKKDNALLLGLRSPLFGVDFATLGGPPGDPNNLRKGVAIVAKINDPFGGAPSFEFKTLNLFAGAFANAKPPCLVSTPCGGNHGIRGMEYIPAMQGFAIIGGPVVKGDDYSLWFWDGEDKLERLDLPDTPGTLGGFFRQLCRPESVMQMDENGKTLLVVTSEQSTAGLPCSPADPDPPPPFTFIKAEIVSGG